MIFLPPVAILAVKAVRKSNFGQIQKERRWSWGEGADRSGRFYSSSMSQKAKFSDCKINKFKNAVMFLHDKYPTTAAEPLV